MSEYSRSRDVAADISRCHILLSGLGLLRSLILLGRLRLVRILSLCLMLRLGRLLTSATRRPRHIGWCCLSSCENF